MRGAEREVHLLEDIEIKVRQMSLCSALLILSARVVENLRIGRAKIAFAFSTQKLICKLIQIRLITRSVRHFKISSFRTLVKSHFPSDLWSTFTVRLI